jgi:hypothetical protein
MYIQSGQAGWSEAEIPLCRGKVNRYLLLVISLSLRNTSLLIEDQFSSFH